MRSTFQYVDSELEKMDANLDNEWEAYVKILRNKRLLINNFCLNFFKHLYMYSQCSYMIMYIVKTLNLKRFGVMEQNCELQNIALLMPA